MSKHRSIRLDNQEYYPKIQLEEICEGICFVVSTARKDQRTGFVGKPCPVSAYTEKWYRRSMRKWFQNG